MRYRLRKLKMNDWLHRKRTDVSFSQFIRSWQAFSVFLHIYKLTCTNTGGAPPEENEKHDRKHFYLAIRNEMFVHRMLRPRNRCFSALYLFFSLRLRGGNICAIVSGVQNQSFYPIFFFLRISHLLVRAVQYGTCCSAFHTARAGMAGPMKRAYWAKLLIRHSTSQSDSRGLCFFSLSLPFDSIFGWRLIVVPFVWCAARDKTASHVNQGSSAAAAIGKEWTSTSQFEISLPDADDKPVVWALVVVRRAATGFLLRLETFEYSNTRSVWKKGGVWTANGMCVEIHRPSSNQQTWNYKFSDELNAECEMRKNQRSPCSPEIKISFETPVPFSERCRPIPIFGIEYR